MKRVKIPETELEYWQSIRRLRTHNAHLNGQLLYDKFEDEDAREDLKLAVSFNTDLLDLLGRQVGEKFNVHLLHDEPTPDGKISFHDWYQ